MRPPERNEELALAIDNLGSEGQGIGRHEGFAVFVPFALPGERVRARVIKPGKSFAVAKLTEILEKSPERAEPPCPAFGRCGGCTLMHLSYAAQLEYKRHEVENALRRIGVTPAATLMTTKGAEGTRRTIMLAMKPFRPMRSMKRLTPCPPRSRNILPPNTRPTPKPIMADTRVPTQL